MSLPPLNENAGEVFSEAVTRCDQLGITYWVAAGTALGLYRDGDFIEGDTDIDFAVIGTPEDIAPAFIDWLTYSVWHDGDRQYQLALSSRGVIIDFYFHHLDPEGRDYISRWLHGGMRMPREIYENRVYRETKYGPAPFPNPPERYLELFYGDDWRIPQSKDQLIY